MSLNDILLHLDSYPEATPAAAIDQAVDFVRVIGGGVSALAVHIDVRTPRNPLADVLVRLEALAEAEEAKSLAACRAVLKHFNAKAGEAGVGRGAQIGRADFLLVDSYVAARARTRDLCIVPVAGERTDAQRAVAQAVIFESGRPAVVFDPERAPLPTEALGEVLVAWDGSRCAARALNDALPLLKRARAVRVVTVLNDKPSAIGGMGAEAVRHLSAHGVAATAEEVDSGGARIGEALDDCIARLGADLLIMGAYGHSRLQEFILGGATEHLLRHPRVPVLLAH